MAAPGRTLQLDGDGRVSLRAQPRPDPTPGHALVQVVASALCGSEAPLLRGGHPTNAGHEAAGRLISVPPGSDHDVGDLVGITAVRGCGTCAACTAGRETRCAAGPFVQTGLHADVISVHVSQLRRVPPTATAAEAVLLSGDGLGVPVRALRRVPSGAGDVVLVIGLGPVGLAHVLVRASQGSQVHAIEPSAYRRELALRLGARAVWSPEESGRPEPDLVIEATGRPECVALALDTVAAGGTVLQSGECGTVQVSPSRQLVRREVTWTGCWYYASEDHPEMLRLYGAGLPVADLVTHEFAAEDAQAAVDAFSSGRSGKVVLRWDDRERAER